MTADEPDMVTILAAANRLCTVDGCSEPHEARGYCAPHYGRFKRHGDPLAGRENCGKATTAERLARRLRPTKGGCLEWTGARWANGYGTIRSNTAPYRAQYTHRVAFELAHGPIPTGMLVCHSCDNRLCCNADHLFLGTHEDNMRDMTSKGRQAKGSRTGTAKLTERDVVQMRELRSQGMTYRTIGARFGVGPGAASRACRGLLWAHVEERP